VIRILVAFVRQRGQRAEPICSARKLFEKWSCIRLVGMHKNILDVSMSTASKVTSVFPPLPCIAGVAIVSCLGVRTDELLARVRPFLLLSPHSLRRK